MGEKLTEEGNEKGTPSGVPLTSCAVTQRLCCTLVSTCGALAC
jgi:hypothetical protein